MGGLALGAPELLVILVIAVLVIGPGKLAGLGGSLGKSIKDFRVALKGDDEPKAKE
jgi:sec-independent protein translocase protein TatA